MAAAAATFLPIMSAPLGPIAWRFFWPALLAMRLPLKQGEGVIFPVRERPVQGTRGMYRVNMRHGVSRLRSGHRHTLGIIFHDAKT